MTTLLRIDASSRDAGSHSRALGDKVERALLARMPGAHVVRRDLHATPIEHVRAVTLLGMGAAPGELTAELRAATALSDAVIAEVKAAATILITTPMYNFSIPSALKAWIDQLVRPGHTFTFDGTQFGGLLGGRRAVVAIAYGAGGYTDGGAFAAADFVQPYLRFLFNFLGITDVRFVGVERTTADPATVAAETERAAAGINRVLAA